MYKTIEDTVGNTPLVRLQRIAGETSNVVLAKLEGNNPAGSVKDRPALSMVVEAEKRGEIKPGDTLIEATSGNTGIALAMAAAMRGYRMVLVMPEHLSVERRQTMRAFGAEIILTPKAGGMETARDVAEKMRAEGKGVILDQFANPDNPLVALSDDRPGDLARHRRQDHALRFEHGHDRHDHGRGPLPQGEEPGDRDHRLPARRRLADPRHPQVARSLPAQDLRREARRPRRTRVAGRRGRDGAKARARGRHLRRHFVGRRVRGRTAHCAAKSATRRSSSSSATAATAICPPVCFLAEVQRAARQS